MKFGVLLPGSWVLMVCVFLPYALAQGPSVPAPCSGPTEKPGLDRQDCSILLGSSGPMVVAFNSFFSTQVSCYYQGYIPVTSTEGDTSRSNSAQCSDGLPLSGKAPKKNVCSLKDGEDQLNHLNEICGNLDNLDGSWESSQFLGLWVAGVKYYQNQVLQDEILKTHTLSIHPRCQAIADDYLQLSKQAKLISDKLVASMPAAQQSVLRFVGSDFDFCSKDAGALPPQFPSGAACYLSISRTNREAMFFNLAKCEVWARLDGFYAEHAVSETQQVNALVAECTNTAIEAGKKVGLEKLSIATGEEAGIEAFKTCYRPKIHEFFNSIAKEF